MTTTPVTRKRESEFDTASELLAAFRFPVPPTGEGFRWVGTSGVRPFPRAVNGLNPDRVVKVTLVEQGHADHYEGLRMEIVSKTHGAIDSTFVPFADYVAPGRVSNHAAHVWRNRMVSTGKRNWAWYGYDAMPDLHAFVDAVESWIEQWR